jgi:prefoldin subunit 5
MSRREVDAIKLDFEDLVKELDQFEQDIQSLQSRINQFMNDARQVTVQMVDIPDEEGVEVGDSGGT